MHTHARLALIIGLLALSPGCQSHPDVSPGLDLQQEDYAQARSAFKTKLLRHGPSPQPGHSAGGTLAMLAARASNRFRAAASLSGSPDQKANALSQPTLAVFDQSDPRELQLRSPVAYSTSFKSLIRMYFGDQERWATLSTQRTAGLAKQKGLDVEAIEVPGDRFSSVPEAIRKSIEFFKLK